jgi:RNA-directed DNA polymerase
MWMKREHREIPFERYADDAVCHCQTEEQATQLKAALAQRFADCKLELHEQKTKIVYCADSRRTEKYPTVQFDFLGYSFRPRFAKSKDGKYFVGFNPAISPRAAQAIRKTMREWRFSRRVDLDIEDLARQVNPIFRGWLRYYGFFHRSALWCIELAFREHLVTWAKRKFRRLSSRKMARRWVAAVIHNRPRLFACQGVRLAAIG